MSDDLTPRQKSGKFTSLSRQQRERFYISFNVTGSYDPATGKYTRAAWPILFKSRGLAEDAMKVLPIFLNSAAMHGRGRLKSASVEKTMLPAGAN